MQIVAEIERVEGLTGKEAAPFLATKLNYTERAAGDLLLALSLDEMRFPSSFRSFEDYVGRLLGLSVTSTASPI
ncbi:MAG: hypothetical protein HYV03_05150 [Deltaproteobacteria bacterium]|nr:hypothetical protein [Deltaproteobacteria bacterium]